MLKKIFFLFLVITALLSGCGDHDRDQKVKNIEAFARAYGVVRWFYPADETQQIDWNGFAVYGVSQVADCRTTEELKSKLEALFLPIASGIRFSTVAQYDAWESITPSDTTGMVVVSWQHYGVDLGLWSNRYVSKRTHRPLHTHNTSKLAVEGLLPAAAAMDTEVTIRADIKNNTPDDLKIFFRAAINESTPADYINFCVADTTLKPIDNTSVWQTHTRSLNIKPEHANALIRYGIYTDGAGEFSIKNISIRLSSGKDPSSECAEFGNPVVYNYSSKGAYRTISTKTELFDEKSYFGDIATKELVHGLYVHVPLALYGTDSGTYPACEGDGLSDLQRKIASAKLTDGDLMAADLIVTWNVFNYFHPYLAEQQIAWDGELTKALRKICEHNTYHLRPLKLMTACLNDAHINIFLSEQMQAKEAIARDSVTLLPFWVKKIDDRLVIEHTLCDEFCRGDVVKSVNGADAMAGFRSFENQISGSPQVKAAKARFLWLKSFAEEATADIGVERGGQRLEISADCINVQDYLRAMEPRLCGRQSGWIDEQTLYLNLGNTNMDRVRELLAGRDGDHTVILDARNDVSFQFIHIVPLLSGASGWNMRSGIIRIPHVTRPETPVIADALSNRSSIPNKKNIFLTTASYSHYEETLDYVRYSGLGYLVGTKTGGCNGAINVIPLPSGNKIWFTGTKVLSNMGSDGYYYATGIEPDVYVDQTIDDIVHDRDAVLECALNINNNTTITN